MTTQKNVQIVQKAKSLNMEKEDVFASHVERHLASSKTEQRS